MRLRNTTAPNLPLAPREYEQFYIDQLNNILRLYFNQIDNFTTAIANEKLGYTVPVEVASLPSAVDSGMGAYAFVSDSSVTTFASIVAGGGTNPVPVYSDGTNWRVG